MIRNILPLSIVLYLSSCANLFVNSNLYSPIVPSMSNNLSPSLWKCFQIQFRPPSFPGRLYQYVILEDKAGPGYIQQTVNLPFDGDYNITFDFEYMRVDSNCVLMINCSTKQLTAYLVNDFLTYDSVARQLKSGPTTFRFTQVSGPCRITNLTLQYIIPPPAPPTPAPPTPLVPIKASTIDKGVLDLVAIFLALATTLSSFLPFLRSAFLYFCDLWMYSYVKKNYSGAVKDAFQAIQYIEKIKFEVIPKFLQVKVDKSELAISNYTAYSQPKFVQMDESSQIFLQSNLMFFASSCPYSILMCILLYILWGFSKNCQILRKRLRGYYFVKLMIIFTLLEQNLIYFIFVCFANFEISFTFQFMDKLSLIFTLIVCYSLVLYCVLFYFFLGLHPSKSTEEFNNGVRKCFAGHIYLTSSMITRCLIKGVVFQVLQNNYSAQMAIIGSIEIIDVISIIFFNYRKSSSIFQSLTYFWLSIFYHLTLASLNFTFVLEESILAMGESFDIQNLFSQTESVIVYTLSGLTLLEMIYSLIPFRYLRRIFNNQQIKNTKTNTAHTVRTLSSELSRRPLGDMRSNTTQRERERERERQIIFAENVLTNEGFLDENYETTSIQLHGKTDRGTKKFVKSQKQKITEFVVQTQKCSNKSLQGSQSITTIQTINKTANKINQNQGEQPNNQKPIENDPIPYKIGKDEIPQLIEKDRTPQVIED